MSRRRLSWVLGFLVFPAGFALAESQPASQPATKPATQPATYPAVDLTQFHTVANAITAKVKPTTSKVAAQIGHFGISVAVVDGKPVVEHVEDESPAERVGMLVGDQVLKINDTEAASPQAVRDLLLLVSPGEPVRVRFVRAGKEMELTATMSAVSRPMRISGVRAILGVSLKESADGEGAAIERLTPELPAGKAGLQVGDVILKVDDAPVSASATIGDLLASYAPEDTIAVVYRRAGKQQKVTIKLAGDPRASQEQRTFSSAQVFRKNVYKLAVLCVEYPDVKHSETIKPTDWEASLFSTGTYNEKSVTGQTVFGSLNDYYQEVSCGKLKVEGKVFPWVTAKKNRTEYGSGSGDTRLLNEVMDKVFERDGKDALKDFDGVLFLYAGERMETNRGNLYWPHKSLMIHQGHRYTFFICPEGGSKMTNISVFVHEFGHMLGLPDLYARPENPGSEGLGQWCLMSNQLGNGRPQHMSAWCKEQLGWLTPTVIDPAVKQKLVLSPVEKSDKECFKVLVRADGSEYFLLEAKKKTGFDTDLPAEGMLIWRVVRNRPILEESHGVEGPLGPRSFLRSVPFPSVANDAFTPYTTPDSRSQLGAGLSVFITDIERHADGKVTFSVGYETY